MEYQASHKVPEGKMINIELEVENQEVSKVKVHGDFFIEPPEKLESFEKRLEGLKVEVDESEAVETLREVEADLIGFTREDLVEAFKKALGDEK